MWGEGVVQEGWRVYSLGGSEERMKSVGMMLKMSVSSMGRLLKMTGYSSSSKETVDMLVTMGAEGERLGRSRLRKEEVVEEGVEEEAGVAFRGEGDGIPSSSIVPSRNPRSESLAAAFRGCGCSSFVRARALVLELRLMGGVFLTARGCHGFNGRGLEGLSSSETSQLSRIGSLNFWTVGVEEREVASGGWPRPSPSPSMAPALREGRRESLVRVEKVLAELVGDGGPGREVGDGGE